MSIKKVDTEKLAREMETAICKDFSRWSVGNEIKNYCAKLIEAHNPVEENIARPSDLVEVNGNRYAVTTRAAHARAKNYTLGNDQIPTQRLFSNAGGGDWFYWITPNQRHHHPRR